MTHPVYFTVTSETKIHYASCEQRIANVLRRLRGVQDVQASAHTQRVGVTIDPTQAEPEQVQAKLEQLGYEVTPQAGGVP